MSDDAPRNDIAELRKMLFDSIRDVRAGKMPVDDARSVNELAKTVVDTARVEVAYLNMTGGSSSTFLEGQGKPGEGEPQVPGRTVHRLR